MSRREQETTAERAERLEEFANRGGTISKEEYVRRTRRSFLSFGATGVGTFMGFKYLQGRPENDNIPDVIRKGLEWNEGLWETIDRGGESPSFDISDREPLRVNGRIGVRDEIDLDQWSMRVVDTNGAELETLTLAPVQQLPTFDKVWEHKCIEGWSNIVHWTGALFSDFAARYDGDLEPDYQYVSFRTPDEDYYVGLDAKTALHSQTLMAWALNGETLTQLHGAPLRLATPLKYGIKQLKRIGTIEFTNERPADYWAERGYDWYAGF